MQSPEEFCSSSTPGRMILLQWKQTVRNPIFLKGYDKHTCSDRDMVHDLRDAFRDPELGVFDKQPFCIAPPRRLQGRVVSNSLYCAVKDSYCRVMERKLNERCFVATLFAWMVRCRRDSYKEPEFSVKVDLHSSNGKWAKRRIVTVGMFVFRTY